MTNVQKAYDRVYRNQLLEGNVIPKTLGKAELSRGDRTGYWSIENAFSKYGKHHEFVVLPGGFKLLGWEQGDGDIFNE